VVKNHVGEEEGPLALNPPENAQFVGLVVKTGNVFQNRLVAVEEKPLEPVRAFQL